MTDKPDAAPEPTPIRTQWDNCEGLFAECDGSHMGRYKAGELLIRMYEELQRELAQAKADLDKANTSANKWYVQAMTQSSATESALTEAKQRIEEYERLILDGYWSPRLEKARDALAQAALQSVPASGPVAQKAVALKCVHGKAVYQRCPECEEAPGNGFVASDAAPVGQEAVAWISVEDRLPSGIRDVLLLTTSKVWIIGDWYQGAWRTHRSEWKEIDGKQVLVSAFRKEDITHWTPLPPTDHAAPVAPSEDAERYRWLCDDLDTEARARRSRIFNRMSVMGKGAIDAAIDAAMQAGKQERTK